MVTAVVLAAGASTRMGVNKLLLPLAGEPIVRRTVREVCAAGFDDVLVVLGRDPEIVGAAVAGLPCRFAFNPDFVSGLGSSFRAAVAHLDASEAALFALADQPFVTHAEYRAVLDAFDRLAPAIVSVRYGGVTAPPHLFARELFPELADLEQGAKPVLVRHAERAVVIDLAAGHLVDIDTPDDYARAQDVAGESAARADAPGAHVDEAPAGDHAIVPARTARTAFVDGFAAGPLGEPVLVTSFAQFEQTFGGLHPHSEASYGVRLFFLNGGREALIVRVPADWDTDAVPPEPAVSAAALIGMDEPRSGLRALRDVGVFNLLCLPAVSLLPEAEAAAVYASAEALCTEGGAFLLIDPLRATGEPPRPGVRSPNAAAYVPAVIVDDPLRPDTTRVLGPSGGVAGVIAALDAARGPWRSPAGLSAPLRGVLALTRALTSAEIDRRVRSGVNPLVAFPDHGPLVWGARTLAGAEGSTSEWKYIPVRRLALLLEASISHGTEWAVFEPQGEPLFEEVRQSVGAFLASLWRQGAFAGRQPREAYFVRCDRTNNPPGAPDLTIDIGFAPLRPAEFVNLRFEHRAVRDS